ncbi:MAG: alpha-ketoacid dehydrogenase subunit beta [Candidatus Bathyarchaeia archaeon]
MTQKFREITFLEALREALFEEMERDETVFLMGEDLQHWGGPWGVVKGFLERFGPERVRDTPISESAFVGAAITAAATGLRPIVEVMFSDFLGVCMDQVINQAAKFRYMFGGQAKVPLVIRTTIGASGSSAAQHSQCLYSIFMHMPGLKCVIPSTPYDAKGLLKTAIRDDDPVMFFEHKLLYQIKGMVPKEEYLIPFGKADIKREGDDVTVVATAFMVHKALKVAEELEKDGISVEVIDPRTIVPLDKDSIIKSVKKTGRLIVVDEDYERCGFASEIMAIVSSEAFDFLDAPLKRVSTPNVPIPYSPILEKEIIPNEQLIKEAIKSVLT